MYEWSYPRLPLSGELAQRQLRLRGSFSPPVSFADSPLVRGGLGMPNDPLTFQKIFLNANNSY